jgi:predicted PurR-regulated permease PerM
LSARYIKPLRDDDTGDTISQPLAAKSGDEVARPHPTTTTASPVASPAAQLRPTQWWGITQAAIIGLFLMAFGALLDVARPILLPIVTALVIGAMLGPLQRRAAEARIPSWLFATAVVAIMLALVQVAAITLSSSIIDWIKRGPEFADILREKLSVFEGSLAWLRNLQTNFSNGDQGMKLDIAGLIQPILGFLTPALGELLIFFVTLFFYLLGRNDLRRQFIFLFSDQDDRLRAIRIFNDIERDLTRYVMTVSVINFALGVVTAIGAWILGFNNFMTLGVLAFVCNYLPYIGPLFMVVLLFGVGLISFSSLGYAALAPLMFICLTTIEGHLITPKIIGMRLTLNPLAVILSLTFWTWLWGPVGAFLSVPFTIIGLVIVNHFSDEQDNILPS